MCVEVAGGDRGHVGDLLQLSYVCLEVEGGGRDTWVAPMGETREQPILDAPAPVDRYKALSYMYS